MSDETRINGKVWKKVPASNDWSDPDTWKGLGIVILIIAIFGLVYYMGWFDNSYYNRNN
jgi:hypothetical protein